MTETLPITEGQIKKPFIYGSIYEKNDGEFVSVQYNAGEKGYEDKGEKRYIDLNLPNEVTDEGRVERIDYRCLPPEGGTMQDVPVVVISNLHPDEKKVAEMAKDLLAQENFPRTETDTVHILAELVAQRGAHRPATEEEIRNWNKIDKRAKATMLNMKVVPDDPINEVGSKGIYEDLNRQFNQSSIPWPSTHKDNSITSLEQIYQHLPSKESRLLAKFIQLHPQAKVLFTLHEDFERGRRDQQGNTPGRISKKDGLYIYHCVADSKHDPKRQKFYEIARGCMNELMKNGFDVYNWIDDTEDYELGLRAHRGIVDQSLKDEYGDWVEDSTFEGFAVRTGAEGLSQFDRAITVEMPQLLSQEREKLATAIVIKRLMLPMLHEYNVPHTST